MRTAVKKIQLSVAGDFKKQAIFQALSVVVGFLLSRTILFQSFMPFGYAFVAALPYNYIFSGLGGVILGSLVPANGGFSAYYIGIAVLSGAIKFICLNVYTKKNSLLFTMITTVICAVFGCISLFVSIKLQSDDYIRMGGEGLLAIGSAYFINQVLPLIDASKPLSKLSSTKICSVIMAASILLMSLADFTVFEVSPSRVFSVLLILLAARYGQVNASTICAVSLGFAMSVTGANLYYIIGAYALGGMLAGVFGNLGKIPTCIGFLLGNTCVVIGFYGQYNLALEYAEITVGCLMFMVMPRYLNKIFLDIFSPPPQLPRVDSMRKNIVMKLKFASNAMNEVSKTVDEIGRKLDEKDAPALADIFLSTRDDCCLKCGLKKHCYETQKDATYSAFLDMTKRMKKYGKLSSIELPEYWAKRCLKPDLVANTLYNYFERHENRQNAKRRVTEIRNIISNQMDGLSDMLYDMAIELNDSERFDTETASRIDTLLRSMGISSTDVSCKIDRRRRMNVEITAKRQKECIPKIELINRLSSLCAVKFDIPCITNGSDITLISLTEKTNYRIDIGVSQINCDDQKLSGDTTSYFYDGKGNFVMVLSDGMGNGARAAVDSTFTTNLFSKLIKSGFGFECALKIVNSAMMYKSTDESMATLDIASIDLYSGQADFYKAGTPNTIVVKGKKVGVATCNAYPAGILSDVKFDKTSTVLQRGNIIVMFSDGVTDIDDEWLENEVVAYRRNQAQNIADRIAKIAKEKRTDGHNDDISVMVAIVENEI